MSNTKRGFITITDGEGAAHVLKYDMNAMVEIQEKLLIGTLDELFNKLDQKMDFKTMLILLWAGFLHAHTDDDMNYTITIKDVGGMDFTLKETTRAINAAFTIFVGIDSEKNVGKPTPKKPAAAAKKPAEAENVTP